MSCTYMPIKTAVTNGYTKNNTFVTSVASSTIEWDLMYTNAANQLKVAVLDNTQWISNYVRFAMEAMGLLELDIRSRHCMNIRGKKIGAPDGYLFALQELEDSGKTTSEGIILLVDRNHSTFTTLLPFINDENNLSDEIAEMLKSQIALLEGIASAYKLALAAYGLETDESHKEVDIEEDKQMAQTVMQVSNNSQNRKRKKKLLYQEG